MGVTRIASANMGLTCHAMIIAGMSIAQVNRQNRKIAPMALSYQGRHIDSRCLRRHTDRHQQRDEAVDTSG